MKHSGNRRTPTGAFVTLGGEDYYRIVDYDAMPPFLMSIPSDTDLWMFVSSKTGLTAGRVDADGSLFPYETEDRLHDAHHYTGPVTLLRVRRGTADTVLWWPLCDRSVMTFRVERALYKNIIGNRVIFEEVNHDLQLAFRMRWTSSDELGHVRTSYLHNLANKPTSVELLDGLRNVLPFGAPTSLYQRSSNLVDAYKRTEIDPKTPLGIFSLTSRVVDRPEAAESLRANTVWCHGLDSFNICLSLDALDAFREGATPNPDTLLTGRRGNYFVSASIDLDPDEEMKWHLAADAGRGHRELASMKRRLIEASHLDGWIEDRLDAARDNLRANVASADGLQLTGHAEADAHHFANVLFNNMRGGVFVKNHDVPAADFTDFVRTRNRNVAETHAAFLGGLPREIPATGLVVEAAATGDRDLERLSYEYLPLFFGRRHGDPSRPWNRFTIRVRNTDGTRALHYEGNWRDIFQNWEALSVSFPAFLPNFVAKFVNASTVDGFNPYRINRDGIDWEVIEPDDPWSHIGYWGDHQIIYLLKLLEAWHRYSPDALMELMARDVFCYADVPYRLKGFEQIVADPNDTIAYDTELARKVGARVSKFGSDGRLVPGPHGGIYHANLLEKLLVPALSKLSNYVAGGGIWMNTQRPEWNDANNVLVGHGASMVTLCYLRRYLKFLEMLLSQHARTTISVSTEVIDWLERVHSTFNTFEPDAAATDARVRRGLLAGVGEAFSEYRERVYNRGFSGKGQLPVKDVVSMCLRAVEHLDRTIHTNKRQDGLYHSYNLIEFSGDEERVTIQSLDEMLEGQVAVLSSGILDAENAARLTSSLFDSRLHVPDRGGFLLYPDRDLPAFVEKNVVPEDKARAIPLVRELLDSGNTSILARDVEGTCRFNADFTNERDVERALERLASDARLSDKVDRDRQAVVELFEAVFGHRSFLGRSRTMYAYEGLGSIYWHMVAKLLLAVQENVFSASRGGRPSPVLKELIAAYYEIRSGFGFERTVSDYGAFPTDPYSHTPSHSGARQPGMTGQVKEEILTRLGEMGVNVEDGRVSFGPTLLKAVEFRESPAAYDYLDIGGLARTIDLPAGSLAFSLCQVPVIYLAVPETKGWIRVTGRDGASTVHTGDSLGAEYSRAILDRSGQVSSLHVAIPKRCLLK